MIFLKSMLAGVLAVFVSTLLVLLCVSVHLALVYKPQRQSGTVAWDPISITRPSFWLLTLVVFLAGFLWELRRARSK